MTIGIIKPILRDPAANPSCFPFRPPPAFLVLFPIPIVLFPRQLHIPPFPDPKLRMILYREPSGPPANHRRHSLFGKNRWLSGDFFLTLVVFIPYALQKILNMFTDKDLAQISAHGLTPEQVERQMSYFGSGFPYLNIDRPAVADDGIRTLDERQVAEYAKRYDEFSQGKRIVKFVPASGAATRMFKALFEYLESGVSNPATEELLANLDKFAFAEEAAQQALRRDRPEKIIRGIVARKGSVTAACPKRSSCFTATATGTAPRSRNTSAKGRSTPPTATGR